MFFTAKKDRAMSSQQEQDRAEKANVSAQRHEALVALHAEYAAIQGECKKLREDQKKMLVCMQDQENADLDSIMPFSGSTIVRETCPQSDNRRTLLAPPAAESGCQTEQPANTAQVQRDVCDAESQTSSTTLCSLEQELLTTKRKLRDADEHCLIETQIAEARWGKMCDLRERVRSLQDDNAALQELLLDQERLTQVEGHLKSIDEALAEQQVTLIAGKRRLSGTDSLFSLLSLERFE